MDNIIRGYQRAINIFSNLLISILILFNKCVSGFREYLNINSYSKQEYENLPWYVYATITHEEAGLVPVSSELETELKFLPDKKQNKPLSYLLEYYGNFPKELGDINYNEFSLEILSESGMIRVFKGDDIVIPF